MAGHFQNSPSKQQGFFSSIDLLLIMLLVIGFGLLGFGSFKHNRASAMAWQERQAYWDGLVAAQPTQREADVARYVARMVRSESCEGLRRPRTGASWDPKDHEQNLIEHEKRCLEIVRQELVAHTQENREHALALIENGMRLEQ